MEYTVTYSRVGANRTIGTYATLAAAFRAARDAGAIIPRRQPRLNVGLAVRGHERSDDYAVWIEADSGVRTGYSEYKYKGVKAMAEDQGRYNIVRQYFRGGKRIVRRGVTLTEAQAHCSDPETSSRTATSAVGRRRTRQKGPWFDGYEACRR